MLGIDCATVWYSERKEEREEKKRKREKHNDLFSWARREQLANNLDRAL